MSSRSRTVAGSAARSHDPPPASARARGVGGASGISISGGLNRRRGVKHKVRGDVGAIGVRRPIGSCSENMPDGPKPSELVESGANGDHVDSPDARPRYARDIA